MIKILVVWIALVYFIQEACTQQETVSKWTLRQELLARNAKYTLDAPNSRTKIRTRAIILGVDKINMDDMEFSVKFLLRLTWNDYRLVYGDQQEKIKTLPITNPQSIWTPNICFEDDKREQTYGKIHLGDHLNVYPDGKVIYEKRVAVTVPCNINKRLLPLQSQKCTVRWKLCGPSANSDDVQLIWEKRAVVFGERIYFSPYNLDIVASYADSPKEITEPRGFLYAAFYISKDTAYYFNSIYIPYSILIMLAGLQLFFSEKQSTNRMLIGLTALVMYFYLTYKECHIQRSCFISTSFIFIFSLLVESVLVLHFDQKEKKLVNEEDLFKETDGRFMYLRKLRLLKPKDIDKIVRWIYPILFILFCVTYYAYIRKQEYDEDFLKDPEYVSKVNVTLSPNTPGYIIFE